MTSRGRKDRGQSAGSEELQLWYGIRTHLKQLEKINSISSQHKDSQLETSKAEVEKISKKLADLERTGSSISSSNGEELRKEYGTKRELCLKLFAESKGRTIEEQVAIDGALEKIGILSALMSAPDTSTIDGNKRKKRRTDAASPAPSRSPSIQPPSSSSNSSSANEQRKIPPIQLSTNRGDRTNSSSSNSSTSNNTNSSSQNNPSSNSSNNSRSNSNSTSTPNPKVNSGSNLNPNNNQQQPSTPTTPSIRRSNTNNKDEVNAAVHSSGSTSVSSGSSHMDPAKARREALASQLPLQKGRRVAFREPPKKTVNGSPVAAQKKDEDETWIMATVVECINNDRNRYVVQDDAPDETSKNGTLLSFNTTLKAIVPLPMSINTLPERDYPPGSHVLGLYPDTSCFYKAIVRGGGPNMEQALKGNPAKLAKREHELLRSNYQLVFEDDDNEIRLVPAYLVVERPGGGS